MVSIIRKISFCILLIVSVCYAQPDLARYDNHQETLRQGWLSLGIGGSHQGLTSLMSFSLQKNAQVISMRHIYNTELNILGLSPSESVWDFSLLYGRSWRSKIAMISVSGGLGLVGGVERGDIISGNTRFPSSYRECPFRTIGFPLDIQLALLPFHFLGMGVQGYANFNSKQSFYGFLLSLQIGKLR